ncbi:ATP-grasp domain-containing protein [Glycomyces sp. NPDC046736]|uniref:ATP-grasp domain-containing protein n=1 Tax=Glycomyces sp. NPDC046736 TaxID=3155615 RepID=UPI003403B90D
MTALLLCADPLAPARSHRADPHFAREAEAADEVAVIDHDALDHGDATAAVRHVPRGLGPAWYRGWMVTASRYASLERALADRGCRLLADADAYRRAHELPGWYDAFKSRTPASVWTAVPDDPWLNWAVTQLGSTAAIVKDFVKSRKHEWATACHIPDLADAAGLRRVVTAFRDRQGEDLYGGVVLRAFEDFTDTDGATDQARAWWLDGEPIALTAHPDTPANRVEPDLTGIHDAVTALGCRFVTTDLARRSDGVWRVIEVGDGQVSDYPADTDARPLIEALLRA